MSLPARGPGLGCVTATTGRRDGAAESHNRYEVKLSASLAGAASCVAAAALEETGIAWHPDPCALALSRYLAPAATLAAPTPHGFDEFLLDDVYRDDPRAFLPSTLVALFTVAKP